jgi:hypothetical protein
LQRKRKAPRITPFARPTAAAREAGGLAVKPNASTVSQYSQGSAKKTVDE